MAYDVSGNYDLPSPEYPLIPNTLADANDLNAIFTDVETALGSVILRSGVAQMTGPLKLADGTALLPGLTFGADTNSGLYRVGADSVGVTVNGAQVARFETTGLIAAAANITAVTATTLSGTLTGNVTGNLTGNVTGNVTGTSGSTTGNAATATVLQTARTINGVSFNGSANITVADDTKLPLTGGTLTGQLTVAATGPVQTLLRTATASGYTSFRLYNDQNSSVRALEIDYMGSTYSTGEAGRITTTGAYPLYLGTNNADRIALSSSGAVSIGSGYAGVSGDLGIARPGAPTEAAIFFGTTSAKYLSYDGSVFAFAGGAVQATNFTATSDARLKRDVVQIDGALGKVQQVRGVTFERIDEPGRRQTGVLAQELQVVLPEAVSTFTKDATLGGTDEYLTVNHGAVIGLLIEAIKELNAKVEALS